MTHPAAPVPDMALELVVVSLKTGTDIKGLLRDHTPEGMVLTSATIAGEENGHVVWRQLVGEVVIPVDNIDYFQRRLPLELNLGG
jgi:hypothetical protein